MVKSANRLRELQLITCFVWVWWLSSNADAVGPEVLVGHVSVPVEVPAGVNSVGVVHGDASRGARRAQALRPIGPSDLRRKPSNPSHLKPGSLYPGKWMHLRNTGKK